MDALSFLPLQWGVRSVLAGLVATLAACGFQVGSTDGIDAPTPNAFGAPTQGPWTALTGVTATPIVQAAWYREILATGSYGPTVTETAHSWDSALAAFRVAP